MVLLRLVQFCWLLVWLAASLKPAQEVCAKFVQVKTNQGYRIGRTNLAPSLYPSGTLSALSLEITGVLASLR